LLPLEHFIYQRRDIIAGLRGGGAGLPTNAPIEFDFAQVGVPSGPLRTARHTYGKYGMRRLSAVTQCYFGTPAERAWKKFRPLAILHRFIGHDSLLLLACAGATAA
jgi:hypothetical protein